MGIIRESSRGCRRRGFSQDYGDAAVDTSGLQGLLRKMGKKRKKSPHRKTLRSKIHLPAVSREGSGRSGWQGAYRRLWFWGSTKGLLAGGPQGGGI